MGSGDVAARTPARPGAAPKKPAGPASTGKQASILGFFSKTATPSSSTKLPARPAEPASSPCLKETTKSNAMARKRSPSEKATPVPSSDAVEPRSPQDENRGASTVKRAIGSMVIASSSPIKKGRKTVNYAESSDDDDEDVFAALKSRQSQRLGRSRPSVLHNDDDDEDDFRPEPDAADAADYDDDGKFCTV